MRALKISVIGMGVLLVVGLVVVVVTLIMRATELGETDAPPIVAERLALAPGDRIASAALDGFQALLVVDRSAGHQDVLVVDTRTGQVTLTLTGAADTNQ